MIVRATAALVAIGLAACQPSTPAQQATQPRPAGPAAAAAAPAAPAEPPPFEVALQPPPVARAGQAATARVVLRATGVFHVNRDYPMAFRPEPGSVAAFGGERVALGAGAERTPCPTEPEEACAVSAPLTFTLRDPGEGRLAGTVAFSVCTKELCRIEKVPLALAVTVSR